MSDSRTESFEPSSSLNVKLDFTNAVRVGWRPVSQSVTVLNIPIEGETPWQWRLENQLREAHAIARRIALETSAAYNADDQKRGE